MTEPKYHPVQDTCDYKGSFEASTSESLLLNQHQCHGNYAQQKRSRALIWIFHGILLLCNFATAVILWGSHFNRYRTDIEDMEYAPIKKIVRTEVRYRNLTFGHPTEYTAGSGPEVDELWDKITAPPGRVGNIYVEKEELDRLKLSSVRIANETRSIVTLDVFHQLHCLNMLRQALADDLPRKRHQDTLEWKEHRDHCIDSLRLSLQCQPDLSLLSFKWIKDYIKPFPDFRAYHTCRNWDDILEWARDHFVPSVDAHLYVHPQLGSYRIDQPHKLPEKIEWMET